ncbi:MAG TPA: hypothetical protein VK488_15265 [Gaiellaceae bacterium]|nr:hypothetical protein [Gaiellaceae bacterium]
MAGWDTLRGVGFQHAVAIAAALDLVEAANGIALQIEGDADIIDLLVTTQANSRAIQARSRAEPGNWPPAELAAVVAAWIATNPDPTETLEFVSDASLSRDSARKLIPALERYAAGLDLADDVTYVAGFTLDVDRGAIGRVSFRTRAGGTTELLTNALLRVATLLQSSPSDAEDAVARLFQLIAVSGGSSDRGQRTFTRSELANALGISLEIIDGGAGWGSEIRAAYLSSVVREGNNPNVPPEPAVIRSDVEVDLQISEEGDTTVFFGKRPTTRDLRPERMPGLLGPAGSGKSTTLRVLTRRRAEGGGLPFLISVASYVEGDLLPRLDRLIQRQSGRRVRPGIADAALRSEGAWLLLDGLTGLADSARQALLSDLRRVREEIPGLMLGAADRDAALLRRLGLTIYFLQGPGRDEAIELAGSIVGKERAEEALDEIQTRLPDGSSSPLILTMALRLWDRSDAPTTRMQLYAAALEALRERSDVALRDGALEVVTRVAFDLVAAEAYEADRYWWLVALRQAMDAVNEERMYDLGGMTAEAILAEAQATGLLAVSAERAAVGFIHDSFRDYFVARALHQDPARIPTTVGASWEPSLQMLAEVTGVTPPLVIAAGSSVPLCALLAPLDRDRTGDRAAETPELIRYVLVRHLGRWPEGLDPEHLRVTVSYAPQHRYVALASADVPAAELLGEERFLEVLEDALYAFALPGDGGPLSIAFAVWREVLAFTTNQIALGGPRVLPHTDNEIVERIANDFRERRDALDRYAHDIFPTMADRLVAEIGWHGLKARLLPPTAINLGPGFLASTRWLAYDTRTAELDVAVAVDGESTELASRAELDTYLAQSPDGSALKALVDELEKLAPRQDLR